MVKDSFTKGNDMKICFFALLFLGAAIPFFAFADAGFVRSPESVVQIFSGGDSVRLKCPFEEIRGDRRCSVYIREGKLNVKYNVSFTGGPVYRIGRSFYVSGAVKKGNLTIKVETDCSEEDESEYGPADHADCLVVLSQDIDGALKWKGVEIWIYRGDQVLNKLKLIESTLPSDSVPPKS